jgi:hypothetical protein
MFLSSTKLENGRQNRFCLEAGRGGWCWHSRKGREVASKMYTHVSKCKNDKINKIKKMTVSDT